LRITGSHLLRYLAKLAFHAGGVGLFVVGTLDSSFLMLPLGNDILILALSAHNHTRAPYYALMATAGSVLGCFITIWLSSKGNESVRSHLSGKQANYLSRKVAQHGGWMVAIACLMPPPFPFTTVIGATAVLNYPKRKLLAIVGAMRFLRFAIEAGLGVHYGRWIVMQAESPQLQHFIIAITILSIGGSAYSIFKWIRNSKPAKRKVHTGHKTAASSTSRA
jgi:membrane protein YqaA with SNARE-associated domain